MVKAKTLKTRKKSSTSIKKNKKLKVHSKLIPYSPTEEILDEKLMGAAIVECLQNNDPEGVIEIISTYLEVLNKVKLARKTDIPRSTLYHSLKHKNPTIKTLARLVHAASPHITKR